MSTYPSPWCTHSYDCKHKRTIVVHDREREHAKCAHARAILSLEFRDDESAVGRVKRLSLDSASNDTKETLPMSNKISLVVAVDRDDGSHVYASEILLSQRQDDGGRGKDDGAYPKDVIPVEVSRDVPGRDDIDV